MTHHPHPDPSPCVEHVFGNVLHREFPMHVAKIREWKRTNETVPARRKGFVERRGVVG